LGRRITSNSELPLEQRIDAYSAFNAAMAEWQGAYLEHRLETPDVPIRHTNEMARLVTCRARVMLVAEKATLYKTLEVVGLAVQAQDDSLSEPGKVHPLMKALREAMITLLVYQRAELQPGSLARLRRAWPRLRRALAGTSL
jgi:hypothetical protein